MVRYVLSTEPFLTDFFGLINLKNINEFLVDSYFISIHFQIFSLKLQNKLELSSAKLRRLMKLCWEKFDEMIFDSLEAILKDS